MTTFIIATRNAHKVEEIRSILGPEFRFLTLRDFPGAPAVVEDANTFAGNATKKALELARWLGSQMFNLQSSILNSSACVLADDSGLEVDALNGAPGVHSARFATLDTGLAANSSDADNNAKLLRMLSGVPDEKRSARFRCVLALTPLVIEHRANASPVCHADEAELSTELFDGTCEGRIARVPSGTHGFGYDPLFVPEGFAQSYAEIGDEVKNRISHRARALEKLRLRLAAPQPRGG
jgi:XTP/dITP diphosphohydrolase